MPELRAFSGLDTPYLETRYLKMIVLQRTICILWAIATLTIPPANADERVDYGHQIQPLLAKNCLSCHGPDAEQRQADLRLDTEDGARRDLGGYAAVVPGKPDESELLRRLTTEDADERMPPAEMGVSLSRTEVGLIRRWIEQGARYEQHWSYVKPIKAARPQIRDTAWPSNETDHFLLARLEAEGLRPSSDADRWTLARRVSLDLTGLPPTWAEVTELVNDPSPDAYERFVDRKLRETAFGEHWAGTWLDLARYADSSGYPSDQPREIWGYRDWVIQALNDNQPFDQFTIDQIAGDLLPDPSERQLIATAFHRNTMTQNEGGTSDEEFRVAAVIDRVNTTMAVWMGTTMACAQCHTHKYDPITQREYFELYAILNQTADADLKDESPLHNFFTAEQTRRRNEIQRELDGLEATFANPSSAIINSFERWKRSLPLDDRWQTLRARQARSEAGARVTLEEDGRVIVAEGAVTDTTTVELPIETGRLSAVRLEALADDRLPGRGPGHADGNFVLSQVSAEIIPEMAKPVTARRLRIELVSDRYDFLALAEVQAFSNGRNIAVRGKAQQISTNPDWPGANRAIDGNTDGDLERGKSVSITGGGLDQQWWEVTFNSDHAIDRIVVWKRTDEGRGQRIDHLRLTLFDAAGHAVWKQNCKRKFGRREEFSVSGCRSLPFLKAYADATRPGFNAHDVLEGTPSNDGGWAVGGYTGTDHALSLLLEEPITAEPAHYLRVRIVQESKHARHTLGAFRIAISNASNRLQLAELPADVLAALGDKTPNDGMIVQNHYVRNVAPQLKAEQKRFAELKEALEKIGPATVPVMVELSGDKQRETRIQRRGNWQDVGEVVSPGVPGAFHALPSGQPRDRLGLARWLVSSENPLVARVVVNRFWEAIFGVGIVRTSEEFGSQGERPLHPELLDWLAVDLMENGWDVKRLLKQLVTSRAYQQDSRCTPELVERDPQNRLLARGPRFRPTGELLRDQALAVSGLLCDKMGGPPVRPMAPNTRLKTAFGRSNDWTTSEGEDRHRRSVYTEVQRNAPYASFTTFDGPNREVCTIRRGRTNTPLQAFVTLNDPVFVEAHQSLARRILVEARDGSETDRLRLAYRICLSREPSDSELDVLTKLVQDSFVMFQGDLAEATKMATEPLGEAPGEMDIAELAAWTVVAGVIMNLDEFLMRR